MVITVTPADQEAARLSIAISGRLGEKPDPRMEAIANAVPLREGDKVHPRSRRRQAYDRRELIQRAADIRCERGQ